MSDTISWIGMLFSLTRAHMMAKHRMKAAHFSLFVDVWWIVWAILTKTWALAALNVVYVYLDMKVIYEWRKEQNQLG
jgi:hypothetical protein